MKIDANLMPYYEVKGGCAIYTDRRKFPLYTSACYTQNIMVCQVTCLVDDRG